jgi:predicted metal-dependent phosphotriesterase family hydrolase
LRVNTVLGPVRPEDLGVTLTHEHIFTLRAAGVSDADVHTILVENPRRMLAYDV